jgi:hypothetical protein
LAQGAPRPVGVARLSGHQGRPCYWPSSDTGLRQCPRASPRISLSHHSPSHLSLEPRRGTPYTGPPNGQQTRSGREHP